MDFEKHKAKGIPQALFAEYLITSGICLNPNIYWVTFHGGIDFAYMLRVLLGHDLPDEENGFFELMNNYFCNYFDIKEVKREIEYLSGGLNKVAKELAVDRVGTMHQAGSDSIVTRGVYFKLKELYKKWWSNGENEAIME